MVLVPCVEGKEERQESEVDFVVLLNHAFVS